MRRLLSLLIVLTALLLPSSPGAAQQPGDPLQATTKTVNVELILDASGSMAEPLSSGETRMDAAKRILRQVISDLPEREGVNVGLRVYGHLGDNTQAGKTVSCRSSELLVPVAGLDKPALIAQVEAIQPTGWTPIAYSLEQAAADFRPGGESITNAIVLVTDGEETCDPPQQSCQAAGTLHQSDVAVITHVVGFALTPEQTELVRCVAEEGGGQLFGADDAQQLGTALQTALGQVGVAAAPAPPAVVAQPLTTIHSLAYHQLTAGTTDVRTGGDEAPLLSDDGQHIVFGTHPGEFAADPRNRVSIINADGTGEREVDVYPFLCICGSMLDLGADGARVLSSDSVQLRLADGNGGGGRELLALDSGEIDAMRISGDGSTIIFRVYRDTTVRNTSPSQPIQRGIYAINPDGSGLRQLVGPDQLAAFLGVTPNQAPFFGASSGLDVSYDGSRVVFAGISADIDPASGDAREALFAVNGDGSGLHRLLEPTFTYVFANAISGDGATIAYVAVDFGTGLQEAGVVGFDGGGQRTLTDSTTVRPGTGANLPSGERIQLSFDGSRLLLGSSGVLYDTRGGSQLALGVSTPGASGDPTPLVGDGLYRATMSAAARRVLYLFQPLGEPYQLGRLDLNPAALDGAPAITDASVSPPFVLTEGRSTATVSARVSPVEPVSVVGARVLLAGLPDPNTDVDPLHDDGTAGDATANDGQFTNDALRTNCCAEVGPRTVRIKAETQAADGLRHATAVDVGPFAVTAEVSPEQAPAVTAVPPTSVPATPGVLGCDWTGAWGTSFGEMHFTQSGSTVTGDYGWDEGKIAGTVNGNVLSGSWTEVPSRQPPTDAGDFAFTMSDDCQSFTGKWRYGSSGELGGDWSGTRQPVTPVPPTSVPATVTPTPTIVAPPTAVLVTVVPPTAIPATATPVVNPSAVIPLTPSPTATPLPGTGAGSGSSPAGEFITPDSMECTVAPRPLAALQAIAATPDQAATDALLAAMTNPGLDMPDGQPADAATRDAVLATYRQMTACFNAGKDLAAYALWTDDALRQMQAEPPSATPTPAPEEARSSFRVTQVLMLPDARAVAVWEERGALLTTTFVQVLVRQDDRYVVSQTLDAMVA